MLWKHSITVTHNSITQLTNKQVQGPWVQVLWFLAGQEVLGLRALGCAKGPACEADVTVMGAIRSPSPVTVSRSLFPVQPAGATRKPESSKA